MSSERLEGDATLIRMLQAIRIDEQSMDSELGGVCKMLRQNLIEMGLALRDTASYCQAAISAMRWILPIGIHSRSLLFLVDHPSGVKMAVRDLHHQLAKSIY